MADDEQPSGVALVPVREETVDFYGDAIRAAQLATGEVYVPLRPLCEALGLNWSGQLQRTRRDDVLGDALGVCVLHTPSGPQEMQCLPLKHLPGWLFGVSAGHVKPELREKIRRYRRECFDVLWRAFVGDVMPGAPAPPATGAALALELAEAVATLARQQMEYEQRFTTMADYMRGHVRKTNAALADHESRLHALELELAGEPTVSDAQAAEISRAVSHVAMARAARDGANHYNEVYVALYKQFGVTSYKMVPRGQLETVLAWLRARFDEESGASGTSPA